MKQCLQEKVTAFSKQIELRTDGLYNSDDEKDQRNDQQKLEAFSQIQNQLKYSQIKRRNEFIAKNKKSAFAEHYRQFEISNQKKERIENRQNLRTTNDTSFNNNTRAQQMKIYLETNKEWKLTKELKGAKTPNGLQTH